jgi:hypothetical protein
MPVFPGNATASQLQQLEVYKVPVAQTDGGAVLVKHESVKPDWSLQLAGSVRR